MGSANLTTWWMIFSVVSVLDIVLWTWGLSGGVDSERRFQLLTSATLLLYVVLGMLLGWGIAAVIWFGGVWVFAIAAGFFEASREEQG